MTLETEKHLEEHLDLQRWFLNNGLLNDLHKDTLYLYGTLIHKEVRAVELKINADKKALHYTVYITSKLIKSLELYRKLSLSDGVIDLWRLKRLLNKRGNLNFMRILSSFVRDYCGPKWTVELDIKDFKDYEEGIVGVDTGPTSGVPINNSPNK